MALLSTPAQRRAVAPPGRRERADRSLEEMPVCCSVALAECRRALVTCWGLTSYHRFRTGLK